MTALFIRMPERRTMRSELLSIGAMMLILSISMIVVGWVDERVDRTALLYECTPTCGGSQR